MLMKPILLAVLLSCLLVSCGYWSSSSITLVSNSTPLAFQLHGSDEVQWIWIQGPYQNKRAPAAELPPLLDKKKIIVWKIRPAGAFRPMDDIAPITYGQLNTGWEQEIPQSEPPPPLLDGYVYHVGAVAVKRPVPTLCVYVKGGKLQPYTEDLPESPCK